MNNKIQKLSQFMSPRELEYHVNISVKNSYIYFEIPKAGCSTIKGILQEIEATTLGLPIPEKTREVIHNKKISPLLSPKDIGKDKFLEMLEDKQVFKFSFVRNPYTRLLSAYLSKMRWPEGREKKEIADTLGISTKEKISFEQFLSAVKQTTSYKMNPHWRIQTDQLCWGLVDYNFIGHLENFDQDFQKVSEKIAPDYKFKTKNYSRKTESENRLKNFYNSENINLVKNIYQQDFQTFNYSLELPED